jgi:hypothetical protein
VNVDGVNYASPATFTWTPGSTHTVSAVNSTASDNRSTFVRWSNGGAQTHIITAAASLTLLKADFAVAHSVKAKAVPAGTVVITPASADGFYPSGTTLTLTATPAGGYCFTGWTGLFAGTPNRTTLTITRSYDLQANFQGGSLTLNAIALYPAAAGAILKVGVTASTGCLWGASSNAAWATLASPATGSGSGVVSLTIAPNTTGAVRYGQLTIGTRTVSIYQSR